MDGPGRLKLFGCTQASSTKKQPFKLLGWAASSFLVAPVVERLLWLSNVAHTSDEGHALSLDSRHTCSAHVRGSNAQRPRPFVAASTARRRRSSLPLLHLLHHLPLVRKGFGVLLQPGVLRVELLRPANQLLGVRHVHAHVLVIMCVEEGGEEAGR